MSIPTSLKSPPVHVVYTSVISCSSREELYLFSFEPSRAVWFVSSSMAVASYTKVFVSTLLQPENESLSNWLWSWTCRSVDAPHRVWLTKWWQFMVGWLVCHAEQSQGSAWNKSYHSSLWGQLHRCSACSFCMFSNFWAIVEWYSLTVGQQLCACMCISRTRIMLISFLALLGINIHVQYGMRRKENMKLATLIQRTDWQQRGPWQTGTPQKWTT